jgi:hypothetical protein
VAGRLRERLQERMAAAGETRPEIHPYGGNSPP